MERKSNKGAPEPLALIQTIINTHYGRKHEDEWKSPDQLRTWLFQRQLLAQETPLSQGDLCRMIELREAIRHLLHSNSDISVAPEQLELLNYIARHAPCTVYFCQNGQSKLVPGIEGVDGVISLLLGIIFTAMTDGTWTRLKVCRNEPCQKAFYDTSKNRSGAWCAMATCGSRIKARSYRQRQQKHVEEKDTSSEK